MALKFQNVYTAPAYISLLWFDRNCQPDPWIKMGWWLVNPDQTVVVRSEDLRHLANQNFAWFADVGADGACWSGDHWYKVPHNAGFNQCFDNDAGCNALWPFRAGQLNAEWLDFTILLIAPGTANQENQGCVWGIPAYPNTAVVPNVIGEELWQGRGHIKSAGFTPVANPEPTGKQQGSKISNQHPAGGSERPLGTTVTLDWSVG